jgi:hypothetical protein
MIREPQLMEVWRCKRCRIEWSMPFERDIIERSHLCNGADIANTDCNVPLRTGVANSVNVYCEPAQVEE